MKTVSTGGWQHGCARSQSFKSSCVAKLATMTCQMKYLLCDKLRPSMLSSAFFVSALQPAFAIWIFISGALVYLR